MRTVKGVNYMEGEIVSIDARLSLKLITTYEVYEMAMRFDEFKQLEPSLRVSRSVKFYIFIF